jgi:hypothetical protein
MRELLSSNQFFVKRLSVTSTTLFFLFVLLILSPAADFPFDLAADRLGGMVHVFELFNLNGSLLITGRSKAGKQCDVSGIRMWRTSGHRRKLEPESGDDSVPAGEQ